MRLKAFKVLAPEVAVPVGVKERPLIAVVPAADELVRPKTWAELLFVPEEYVWLSTPVPEASEKFWLAATVVGPLSETAPVPVEKVPLPAWVKVLPEAIETLPFRVLVPEDVPKVPVPAKE